MYDFRQVQSGDCALTFLAICSSVVIFHSNAIVRQTGPGLTNVVPLWTKQMSSDSYVFSFPSLSLLPALLCLFLQSLSSYLFISHFFIKTIYRNTVAFKLVVISRLVSCV